MYGIQNQQKNKFLLQTIQDMKNKHNRQVQAYQKQLQAEKHKYTRIEQQLKEEKKKYTKMEKHFQQAQKDYDKTSSKTYTFLQGLRGQEMRSKDQEIERKNKEINDLKQLIIQISLRNSQMQSINFLNFPFLQNPNQDKSENQGNQGNQGECKICMDNPSTMIFTECGHLCVCSQCSERLPQKKCPLCRKVSSSIIKVFSSRLKD